jgi:hypothetical protein
VGVRITPGPPGTAASRALAEEHQRLRVQELDLIREQAGKWRTGLAALLGLIGGIAVIRGSSLTADFPVGSRLAATAGMLAVLLFATVGAFLGMRAAYGLPRRRTLEADVEGLLDYDRGRARRAVRDLRLTIAASFLAVAALGLTAAITWLAGPSAPATIRVTTGTGAIVCGKLKASGHSTVTLTTPGRERTIPTGAIVRMAVVPEC